MVDHPSRPGHSKPDDTQVGHSAGDHRRKFPRAATKFQIKVLLDGIAVKGIRLIDLSTHGCNLAGDELEFRQGQFVSLRFADAVDVAGIVRWNRSGRLGIEFLRSLPFEQLAQWVMDD